MISTIYLLPGLDGTGDLFDPVVAAFGAGISARVVRYPTDTSLNYAEHELLARRALPTDTPYVLLGESFSGPIAISIAASAPPGLLGLILVGSFARNPRRYLRPLRHVLPLLPIHTAPQWLATRIVINRGATPALLDLHRRTMAKVSPAALRGRLVAVADIDVTAALSRIRVPILYLRATHDRLVPRGAADLICRIAPHARCIDISAPHMLLQCAAHESATVIEEFMRSLQKV